MQFFNCILWQNPFNLFCNLPLETTISMSKSLEFSNFSWQNLTQPEATLDTLWAALELSMACAVRRKASFQGQYHALTEPKS